MSYFPFFGISRMFQFGFSVSLGLSVCSFYRNRNLVFDYPGLVYSDWEIIIREDRTVGFTLLFHNSNRFGHTSVTYDVSYNRCR